MDDLETRPELVHKERVARIVWAAHILHYLTNKRSLAELHPTDANVEEDEDCASDYQTERTAILTGPKTSVRQKFLDCISQLLSPSKGWDAVTAAAIRESEDNVEVDVARNDCFLSDNDGLDSKTIDFCRELERHLRATTEVNIESPAACAKEIELKSIDYSSFRIDHWIKCLRITWKGSQGGCIRNEQVWPELKLAATIWTHMIELVLQLDDVDISEIRIRMVQQAYMCIKSAQVRQLLHNAFEPNSSSKLWTILNFIARPMADCRLLQSIASREPQFQQLRISLIPPKPKTILNPVYRVEISEAWRRLGLEFTNDAEWSRVKSWNEDFEEACGKSFSLHAEMQLISHYEADPKLSTTLDYFGCSKKTCLLCEAVLQALPRSIETRGRHGVCYPAWGLPSSRSSATESAINSLERTILRHIRSVLDNPKKTRHKSFILHTPQSGVVSDFSEPTLMDWQRRKQNMELFENERTIKRNEHLAIAGLATKSRSIDRPPVLFEPENSCVMCNASPAQRCSQCHSCYYCSKDCQKSDFPSHKLLCKQFFDQPARPSAKHKRAIYFPADRPKPRMIWLPCERETDEDGSSWTKIESHPYLGSDDPVRGTLRVEHNPVRLRNLGSGFVAFAPSKEGYCVSLIYRDTYLLDGSVNNSSISASVGAYGPIPYQYRGPMIAVREVHHESYDDITLADFRHLIDYLMSYRSQQIRESMGNLTNRSPTVKRGVKICCYGETRLNGSEDFVSVDVSRVSRISLGDGALSPISSRLGMSLMLWKYSDDEFSSNPAGWQDNMTADSNPNAAFLMMGVDPAKPDWGWAPHYWNTDIGNVVTLREDMKDLSLEDVSMMCHFARYKLQRMFEETLESGAESKERLEVLAHITWENMVKHWKENSGG